MQTPKALENNNEVTDQCQFVFNVSGVCLLIFTVQIGFWISTGVSKQAMALVWNNFFLQFDFKFDV